MKSPSQLPIVLLILATLGFVVSPARVPSVTASSEGPATAQSTQTAGKVQDPGAALDSSKDHEPVPLVLEPMLAALQRLGKPPEPGTKTGFGQLVPELKLRLVAVGVPDPCLGHMAFYFDQVVDALRRGAAELGYEQGEFLLPQPGSDARFCGPERAGGRAEGEAFLLFRRSGATPETLAAVLVRESPVLGPKSVELKAAFQLAALAAKFAEGPTQDLPVVGPFFSGSAKAYGERARATTEINVQFVSGTASSPSLKDDLCGGPDCGHKMAVARTVLSDQELFNFLAENLRGHVQKIAYLTEFDTVFGGAGAKNLVDGSASEDHAPKDCELDGATRSPDTKPCVTSFKFPSAIAEIRTAHWRQKAKGDGGVVPGLRRTLEFRPEGGPARSDLPSPLDDVTTFQRELELGKLMTRICRQGFDALAISATDPLDVVFLAEESRKYCPGLRLITFGAEEIFQHPDLRQSLEGMLVVSTYPLLFALEEWTSPDEKAPFSSHVSQGLYNAWLLAGAHSLTKAPLRNGFRRFELSGFRGVKFDRRSCVRSQEIPSIGGPDPESLKCLPAWLLVVRGGEYWPLSFEWTLTEVGLSTTANSGKFVTSEPALPQARPTGFAVTIGILLLMVGILHLGGALWSTGRKWKLSVPWADLFVPADGRRRALWLQYTMANHITFASLSLVLGPTAAHAANVLSEAERPWVKPLYLALVVLGVTLGLVALGFAVRRAYQLARLACRLWRLPKAGDRYRAVRSWLAIVLCSGFGLLALGSAGAQWCDRSLETQLALTRAFHPLGMSAWTPIFLLALGFAAWSLIGLMRVRALVRFTDREPLSPPHSEPSSDDTVKSFGALPAFIAGLPSGSYAAGLWPYEMAAIVAVTPLFVHQVVHFQRSWDDPWRDYLLLGAVLALSSLVVTTLVRFVALGIRLRTYLHWLAGQPMLEAFDRISVKMKSTFGVHFGIRVPDASELEVSVSSATAIAKLASELALESPPTTGAMQAYAAVFSQREQELFWASAEVRRAMHEFRKRRTVWPEKGCHNAFFRASESFHGALRALWDVRAQFPSSEDFEATLDTKDLLSGAGGAILPTVSLYQAAVPRRVFVWMRLAEDFVAMRVATSVSHVILQLRLMLSFALTASFVTVLAVSSYPVEPTRMFRMSAWSFMLAVVVAAATMIVRLEQNEILSRLSGSRPGSVNLHFGLISQLVTYVVLPGIALIAYAFPELRDSLFASLPPALKLFP